MLSVLTVALFLVLAAVASGGPEKASKIGPAMKLMSKVRKGDFKLLQAELDPDYLQYYSREELRILRNTIFAHYGYAFSTRVLQEHFAKFDWYAPDPRATRAIRKGKLITPVEKANMQLIRAHENARFEKVRSFSWSGKQAIYTEASHVFDRYCFMSHDKIKYANEGDSGYNMQEKLGTWMADDLTIVIEWHTERSIGRKSPRTSKPKVRKITETQKLDMYEMHHSELGGGWEISPHLHGCK